VWWVLEETSRPGKLPCFLIILRKVHLTKQQWEKKGYTCNHGKKGCEATDGKSPSDADKTWSKSRGKKHQTGVLSAGDKGPRVAERVGEVFDQATTKRLEDAAHR